MPLRHLAIPFALLLSFCGASVAQPSTPQADADARMAALTSWQDLRVWYIETAPLRTGGYASSHTGPAVARLLTTRWEDLPVVEIMYPETPGFYEFVTAHIGAGFDCKGAQQVIQSARTACPVGTGGMCREVARRLHPVAAGCAP